MPPSVVLTASAWESFGPGAFGSVNGSVVAGAVGVALVSAGGSSLPAPPVLGAWSETMTTGFWPSSSLTTYSAGCSFVGPPLGISATARWRPGLSPTGTCGRATVVGAATPCAALTSVPLSVARTGWYLPDGHHAHASTATSAAAATNTAD